MNKILVILMLATTNLIYSQNIYKEIKSEKINTQKIQLSKNFIQTLLTKCENKNYTEFFNFNLSTDFKKFISENLKKICTINGEKLGKIELTTLNSVYKNKSSLFNGKELYIFDTNTEKNKEIKYLSVWISNENQIDGMVITPKKPLKK